MIENKPYADFMFLGMNSFIEKLREAGTEFSIIEDRNTDVLLGDAESVFNKDTDTILLGFARRGEKEFYFIEYGIKITPNILSYIVFLFEDHPSLDDMKSASLDIEPLVNEYLGGAGKGTSLQ